MACGRFISYTVFDKMRTLGFRKKADEMRYLSLCSGIEAASVAWTELGWVPVAFSEIEPFPCAVLAYHYPDVPNIGDMTQFFRLEEICRNS